MTTTKKKPTEPKEIAASAVATQLPEPPAEDVVLFLSLKNDPHIRPVWCNGTLYVPKLNESKTNLVFTVAATDEDYFSAHTFVQTGRVIRAV